MLHPLKAPATDTVEANGAQTRKAAPPGNGCAPMPGRIDAGTEASLRRSGRGLNRAPQPHRPDDYSLLPPGALALRPKRAPADYRVDWPVTTLSSPWRYSNSLRKNPGATMDIGWTRRTI